jgi:hypothetical protein
MRIPQTLVLAAMLGCGPALRAQEPAPASAIPAPVPRPVQTVSAPAQATLGKLVLSLPRGWAVASSALAVPDGGAAPKAAFAERPMGTDFTPNVNVQEDAVTLELTSYLEQSSTKLAKSGIKLSAFEGLQQSILPWQVAAATTATQGREFALRLYVVRLTQGFLVATCTRLSTQPVSLDADCDTLVQSTRLLE